MYIDDLQKPARSSKKPILVGGKIIGSYKIISLPVTAHAPSHELHVYDPNNKRIAFIGVYDHPSPMLTFKKENGEAVSAKTKIHRDELMLAAPIIAENKEKNIEEMVALIAAAINESRGHGQGRANR